MANRGKIRFQSYEEEFVIVKMRFSERLKELMLPGETQAEFARRLCISKGAVSHYLSGRIPRHDKLVQIAEKTGVSADWLLRGPEMPASPDGPGPGRKVMPSAKRKLGNKAWAEVAAGHIMETDLTRYERGLIGDLIKDVVTDEKKRSQVLNFYKFIHWLQKSGEA